MQSMELYFNEIIAEFDLFKKAAESLSQDISSLNSEQIRRSCENLTAMHKELIEDKEKFFNLMEFFGPGLLETSYIGEFQRALDNSIVACDSLYAEISSYKIELLTRSE